MTYTFIISAVIAQNFYPIAELAVHKGIPIKEEKREMETHSVIVGIKISKFFNFLYLLQTLQYILTYLDSIEKCFNIILSFFLYSLGENKFVYSNKILSFHTNSINPMQKYPHIIESSACML